MKKSILIFILAFFAIGLTTTTFGQLVPRTIECVDLDDPLHVVPGQPYTYEVNVPTPPGAKTYHWFVTQDVNMLVGGALTGAIEPIPGAFLADGDIHYNSATLDADTISLTWQSFTLDPTEYLFVGILVENTDATLGCTTNNLKIYRIEPLHAFSLDIANVLPDGTILGDDYGTNIDKCISDVVSATYDPINDEIDYDFGEDTLFYAVAAANFSGSWELKAQLAGLTVPSQTTTITWGYTFATADAFIVAPAGSVNGIFTAGDAVVAQDPSGTVGPDGEIIYIMMVVDHANLFEGIATSQYTLSVNGNLLDALGVIIPDAADVHHLTPCPQADFDDIALQSLTPRPELNSIIPLPPAGDFLPIGN